MILAPKPNAAVGPLSLFLICSAAKNTGGNVKRLVEDNAAHEVLRSFYASQTVVEFDVACEMPEAIEYIRWLVRENS